MVPIDADVLFRRTPMSIGSPVRGKGGPKAPNTDTGWPPMSSSVESTAWHPWCQSRLSTQLRR